MRKQYAVLSIFVLVLVVLGSVAFLQAQDESFLPVVQQEGAYIERGGHCLHWRQGQTALNWAAPGATVFCDEPFREEYGAALIEGGNPTRSVVVVFGESFAGYPLVMATGDNPNYSISVSVEFDRMTLTATPLLDADPMQDVTVFWTARGPNIIWVDK